MLKWFLRVMNALVLAAILLPAAELARPAPALAGSSSKAGDSGPYFVKMQPLILPLITEDGSSQIINLVFSLEVGDLQSVDKVRLHEPRLTDAFIQMLYGALEQQRIVVENGMVDIDRLKDELRATCNHVLGEKIVAEVLVQGVSQRRL